MANFLKENKDSLTPVILQNNQVFGRVGFSLDKKVLYSLATSLSAYIVGNAYDAMNLAGDGSPWANRYLEECLIPDLEAKGVTINNIKPPITVGQLPWFSLQTKKKTLSLYLGRDSQPDEYLTLYLFDSQGLPFTCKQVTEILKFTNKVKTKEFDVLKRRSVENLNLDLYLKYLYDGGILERLDKPTTIHIDTMFGAYTSIAEGLLKVPNLNLRIYNNFKDPPRLLNYIPKPTGSALRWFTSYKGVSSKDFFFGIDGDGDSLGVFDLSQNTEISTGGVALLLINYLKNHKKIPNLHVYYSFACGSKIKDFCKKLNITCTEVFNYFEDLVKNKNKDEYTFYADELGRFYFNEPYVWANPTLALMSLVQLSNITGRSSAEELDVLYKDVLKKKYFHNHIYILKEVLDLEELLKEMLSKGAKVKNVTLGASITTVGNKSKISLKDNVKDGILEVFIESKTEEELKTITESINKIIKIYVGQFDVLLD